MRGVREPTSIVWASKETILYEIALDLGCDPDYELFAGLVDVDEVFAALPALERWRGFIETHYGLADIADESPATGQRSAENTHEPEYPEIGVCPPAQQSEQTSIGSSK